MLETEALPANHVSEPFRPVASAFSRLVGRGAGGGALVVRVRGQTVVSLCTGTADRAGRRPWTPDTLAISFSTTKGAASAVVHRLVDRGELGYDDRVAAHWPEFGAGGKDRVTVRELMTHRAGLHSVQAVAHQAEDLLDHLMMEERLAARSRDCAHRAFGLPRDHLRMAGGRVGPSRDRPRPRRARPIRAGASRWAPTD